MFKALILISGLVSTNAMAAYSIECVPEVRNTKVSKVVVQVSDAYTDTMEVYDSMGRLVSTTPAEYGDDVDYAYYTSDEADVMVSYLWRSDAASFEGEITLNFNAGPREDILAVCTKK